MPILAFNKATNPEVPDDARLNSDAVRFVEPSRVEHSGMTAIYTLAGGETPIEVLDPLDVVVTSIGGLVAAKRHYAAGQPEGGGNTVFIAPGNISFMRPISPTDRTFWVITFTDGSNIRVLDPLPVGL